MKKSLVPILLILACQIARRLAAQTQSTPYSIIDEGANYRVWARTNYVTGPDGQPVPQVQSYTELQTGMLHPGAVTGQWLDSKSEIDLLPNGAGAVATNGQQKLILPPDIAQEPVEINLPTGQWLRSQVLSIDYLDVSSGRDVVIAQLTNSIGVLEGDNGDEDNVVEYTNALTGSDGFAADVVYKYTLACISQSIVMQSAPPSPADVGLNPNSTLLQVKTEFFQPQQPTVTESTNLYALPDSSSPIAVPDETLDFGAMQMGQGEAFAIGTNSSSEIPVNKQWIVDGQNAVLVESVPWAAVASELTNLPASSQFSQAGTGAARQIASSRRLLHSALVGTRSTASPSTLVLVGRASQAVASERRLVTPCAPQSKKTMKVAKLAKPAQGFCADYVLLNSSATNYVFRSDTTYYITGPVNLSGNFNVFSGGSVLKFANTNNASIDLLAVNIFNQTGPYLPAILTAKDDNSIGSQISGSTGVPTGYYGNPALSITAAMNLSHIRVVYANIAIQLGSFADGSATISDSQFVNCSGGVSMSSIGTSVHLQNDLFTGMNTAISMDPGAMTAVNTTFANTHYLTYYDPGSSFNLTNCILANVTNLYFLPGTYGGDHNGFYNSPTFGTATTSSSSYPFQTAGAGNYYLTNGCAFIGAGTTNIGPALLADLAAKTVYPPVVLSNITVTADTNLNPQAQRDTGTPSLGYHYDPLDWIAYELALSNNAQLTAANGVALAFYNDTGIFLEDGAGISSIGTALYPDWFVQYQMVQEQPVSLGGTAGNNNDVVPYNYANTPSTGFFQFTKFTAPGALDNLSGTFIYHSSNPYSFGSLIVKDCEFWGGAAYFAGGSNSTAVLDNNLFYQTDFILTFPAYPNNSLSLSNNLLEQVESQPSFTQPPGSVWYAFNNVFDTCWFASTSSLTNGHNGYINCTNRLDPVFGGDIITNNAFPWQTGPLGNFYQPTNSAFIGAGSTTVAGAGLTGYTVLTNQTPDTDPIALGYHYFAPPVNSTGTDFWVAFDYLGALNNTNELLLYISSPVSATGTLTIPGLTITNNFSVAADGVTNIAITNAAMIASYDVVQTNGIHITASQPVSVYGADYSYASSAAFTAYPTTLLGTNYCIMAYLASFSYNASEFAIVATENNTIVMIIPSSTADLLNHGITPYTTNLQAGETYQIGSSNVIQVGPLGSATSDDVTGTLITSDKPIAVFAGSYASEVPNGTGSQNPLVQEQLPVDSWGTQALSVSFAGRPWDTYRVLAAYSNTVVTVTTASGMLVTNLDAGTYFEADYLSGPVEFQGSQPIQVAHFSTGGESDGSGIGDPAEILVPPTGHYLATNTIFSAPYNAAGDLDDTNYLTVIAAWSATNSTYVDGSLLAATNFAPIFSSGYYSTQLVLTNGGAHTVTSSQPVYVEVYGWGEADAYGYFGGVIY